VLRCVNLQSSVRAVEAVERDEQKWPQAKAANFHHKPACPNRHRQCGQALCFLTHLPAAIFCTSLVCSLRPPFLNFTAALLLRRQSDAPVSPRLQISSALREFEVSDFALAAVAGEIRALPSSMSVRRLLRKRNRYATGSDKRFWKKRAIFRRITSRGRHGIPNVLDQRPIRKIRIAVIIAMI
jgi:hypothetical protein